MGTDIDKEDLEQMKSFVESCDKMDGYYEELARRFESRIDFNRGIMLGLFYGIVGNFFVQFFYPVIEGIILWKFEPPFYSNTIISVVSLIIILYVTFQFRKRVSFYEKNVTTISELQVSNLEGKRTIEEIIERHKNQNDKK